MNVTTQNRKELLLRGAVALETLAFCREQTSHPRLGFLVEKAIVDTMLDDLAMCTRLDEIDEGVASARERLL